MHLQPITMHLQAITMHLQAITMHLQAITIHLYIREENDLLFTLNRCPPSDSVNNHLIVSTTI